MAGITLPKPRRSSTRYLAAETKILNGQKVGAGQASIDPGRPRHGQKGIDAWDIRIKG